MKKDGKLKAGQFTLELTKYDDKSAAYRDLDKIRGTITIHEYVRASRETRHWFEQKKKKEDSSRMYCAFINLDVSPSEVMKADKCSACLERCKWNLDEALRVK